MKFFRWATDRLQGQDGIVCFVSNNGFLHNKAFDGFRQHLSTDFQRIFHFDFKGNARTTGEQRRREGGNIFRDTIRVGVGITVLVRNAHLRGCQISYHVVRDYGRAEEKASEFSAFKGIGDVPWTLLAPDPTHTWFVPANACEFASLVPINEVFSMHSLGVNTNRDDVVYDFQPRALEERLVRVIEDFNGEIDRYRRAGEPSDLDQFVRYELIKWSDDLKANLRRKRYAQFASDRIRKSFYRPFTKKSLFFDRTLIDRVYRNFLIFPRPESQNRVICCTNHTQMPFVAQVTDCIPNQAPGGRAGQCFPFYTYSPDGSNRRENITDAALENFRAHYANRAISKWDIFHYIYAALHHPAYREKFADNLKRELPRIPFAPDFAAFAAAGRELARLHVDYESLVPWPLEWIENPAVPQSYRVEDKMRLNKDKTALAVNPSLTLAGIPPETFEYRLGNRSALVY